MTTDITDLLQQILATDRPSYESGWRDAYRIGYDAGHEVGYGRALEDERNRWADDVARVARIIRDPSYAALERMRAEPAGDLYFAAVARRGEYTGGPVEWGAP